MGSVAVHEAKGVVRVTESKGVPPYFGRIENELYWICNVCNEPVYHIKCTVYSDVKLCPNFCPHCGTRINKEGEKTNEGL